MPEHGSPAPAWVRLLWLALLPAWLHHAHAGAPQPSANAELRRGAQVQADLPRFGLNLGGWTTWGAEQLMGNVLKNPGLEAGIDRGLLVVQQAGRNTVTDDAPWAGRPPGFWSGAHFAVRSGAASGTAGVVMELPRPAPRAGTAPPPAEFALTPWPPGLAHGDVIALSRDIGGPIPLWWTQGEVRAAPGEHAPGSPGRQAARLSAQTSPAALRHYLDMLGERAGKLLPLQGRWRLAFWSRATLGAPMLAVRLGRDGTPAVLGQTLRVAGDWQRYKYEFDATDPGPPGPVTLSFEASGGELLLDDIALTQADAGPGGFRAAVVATLKALQPGYLRDWQGQLGDSAANRFAPPHARRPSRYRDGEAEWMYGYGVDELFALCAAVGARPWVVLPTTLDDDESAEFGRRLGQLARRYGIDETVVEFGNENWNSLFRPAGIMDATVLARVADRTFGLLRQAAGGARLHLVVGGQYANPGAAQELAIHTKTADGVALAPYFLYYLEAGQSTNDALDAALALDAATLGKLAKGAAAAGRALDIYEINFHTTLGNAAAQARADMLARPAAGTLLAQRLLLGTLSGSRRQAVYALSGFDSRLSGTNEGLIPLWGITRDLAGAGHLRPTGQALQMLNEVAGGNAYATACQGEACADLVALAFERDHIAIVSAARQPLRLDLPCAGGALLVRQLDDSKPARAALPTPYPVACRDGKASTVIAARSLLTALPAPPAQAQSPR